MNTGKTWSGISLSPNAGLPSMDYISRGSSTGMAADHRRAPLPDAFLRRAIAPGLMAFAAADLPGKPARHRDPPLGPQVASKLYHDGLPPARLPGASNDLTADANERRDPWRASHAARWPSGCHHPGEDAVTSTNPEAAWVGTLRRQYRPASPWTTRPDHRSVPVGVSVGALPHHQGGGRRCTRCSHLRGNIPSFIHGARMASRTKFMPSICSCREAAAIWRRGSSATSTLPRLEGTYEHLLPKPGRFFVTALPSRGIDARASIRRRRIARPASFATRPSVPGRLLHHCVEDYRGRSLLAAHVSRCTR